MVEAKTKEDYYHLGNFHLERNLSDQAKKAFSKALKLGFKDARLYNNLGIVQKRLGEIDKAEKSFEKAIGIDPKLYGAVNNLGNIKLIHKQYQKAKECYLHAIKINPYFKDAYNNLGTVWQTLGQLDKAERSYLKALEINPYYFDALNNLGSVYQYQGLTKKAIEIYQRALKVQPDSAEVYYNLASAYDTQDIEKSIEMAQKAVDLSPGYQDAYCLLVRQLQVICEWKKVKKLLPKLKNMTTRAIREGSRPGEGVFFTINNWDDPKRVFEVANAWDKYIANKAVAFTGKFKHTRINTGKQKLRIGYISSDFRNHAIAHQIIDLFKFHNKNEFDIYTYSVSLDDKSYFRKTVIANSKFRDISSLSYADAAMQIYKDKVDILVDLNGYTKGARLEILALKPAPVQIHYLGFPSTTAASFFDYAVVDEIIVPKNAAKYYKEKLIHMPDCYQMQSYSRFGNSIKPKLKIKNDPFIFCCFNNNFKISQDVFKTWMKILKRVPNSLIWVLDERLQSTNNLLTHAKKCGVDPKRIVPLGRTSLRKHLQRLTNADLALDTYPYNGGATTSNALYAGIPVVTLQGKNYVARMSSSLLKAAKIPEMITCNLKDYQELAVKLAEDKNALDAMKLKLKKERDNGALFNGKTFTQNLERAYLKAWTRYLTGKNGQNIRL